METLDLMVAGVCAVFAHAMLRLWRNRHVPGAVPGLLLCAAVMAYVLTTVHTGPSLINQQVSYLSSTLIAPLLFIAAMEHGRLTPRGWKALRWLIVPGTALLAVVNLVTDHGTVAAIAGEAGLPGRSELIRHARAGALSSTTWSSYGFTLLTIGAAIPMLVRSPARRGRTLALMIIPVLVVTTDAAHALLGVTVAGALPTPFAMAAGMLLAAAVLHRSNTLDLRPIARSVLIESVFDGMLVLDARRRIVDCNRAAAEVLRRGREDIIGASASGLLPREFAAMLQSTVHLRSELMVRTDGGRSWFEVDVTPLELRGRRAGHLLVVRDISERRLVQQALEESRKALETANARLVEQSVTDPLTGLKNRRFLFQRLNEEMNRHHRAGEVLGLLVVDLDHFKRVNDTHGHPVGDEALVQVGNALSSAVRDCDVVARLGGEEFAVLAVNANQDGLVHLAERVREAIRHLHMTGDSGEPIVVTASVGAAFAGADVRSAEALFAEADRNLYRAKHQGRDRVVAPEAPPEVQTAG